MSRSIASMTGGSRVAQGATLITTCRTDKDTARKISQMNVKDSDLNVAKYEMCLAPSTKRAKTEAYCNVMSKDPSCPVGNATCTSALPTDSHYQVLAALGVSKLDNSMSTYYRDYYDARSELELFMVTGDACWDNLMNETQQQQQQMASYSYAHHPPQMQQQMPQSFELPQMMLMPDQQFVPHMQQPQAYSQMPMQVTQMHEIETQHAVQMASMSHGEQSPQMLQMQASQMLAQQMQLPDLQFQ